MDPNCESLKMADYRCAQLPFRAAFGRCSIEHVKFLYHLHPEIIRIPNMITGDLPLHYFLLMHTVFYDGSNEMFHEMLSEKFHEMLQFLIKCNKDALSTQNQDGDLPLHIAVRRCRQLTDVKIVFNAFPEAISIRNNTGRTPVEISSRRIFEIPENVTSFLVTQRELERQAREEQIPNDNGQLPLHRAVQNSDLTIGTFKLMIAANPNSVQVADNQDKTPLRVAIQAGNLDAVKCFVNEVRGCLEEKDARGDLPLHHACRHGKVDIVSYILTQTTMGVSDPDSTENLLPIKLLVHHTPQADRDTLGYTNAVYSLISAQPEHVLLLPRIFSPDDMMDQLAKRKFDEVE
jgi:ankyrin repeat protein